MEYLMSLLQYMLSIGMVILRLFLLLLTLRSCCSMIFLYNLEILLPIIFFSEYEIFQLKAARVWECNILVGDQGYSHISQN